MATTTFVDHTTIIEADWLNDVDALVYDVFQASTTIAQVKALLGITTVTLDDNTVDAYKMWDGTINYLTVDTTNGSEIIAFGNDTNNPKYHFLGSGILDFGDYGTEVSGININGTTHASGIRTNDIGGSTLASLHIHRHSTTMPAYLLGSRAKSDTSAHAVVATGDIIFSVAGAGYTGSHYDIFSEIRLEAGTGTISSTSSPGRIVFSTCPDASNTLADRVTITSDGVLEIQDASSSKTRYYTTGAASDQKYWRWANNNGTMQLQTLTDALGGIQTSLSCARSGATPTGTTVTGTLSNSSVNITGGTIACVVNPSTMTATGRVQINNATPSFWLNETDVTTEQKLWRIYAEASVLKITASNSGESAFSNVLSATRSAAVITGVTISISGADTTIADDLLVDTGAAGGGSVFGGATGSGQGAGTINAKGFYVNGTLVSGNSYSVKTADQTILDTTYTDDTHFTGIALTANKRYLLRITGRCGFESTNNINLKLVFTQTPQSAKGTLSTRLGALHDEDGSTDVTSTALTAGIGSADASGLTKCVAEITIFANASTGGTVKVQWASSDTNDVYLYSGMALELIQLN
jgi:hypothetical protein